MGGSKKKTTASPSATLSSPSFSDSARPDSALAAGDLPLPSPPEATSRGGWFEKEVYPHEAHLRHYLRGSYPGVRDVDDVVQESYLRIWRARSQHPIECARAFLFRVARNIALNLLRRQQVSPFEGQTGDDGPSGIADPRPSPREYAAVHDDLHMLAQAIDSLPPRCREIVILRRLHQLSQKEIAQRLGIAEETVETQIVRGVRRCAAFMKRQGISAKDVH